jgi:hypothetical protein
VAARCNVKELEPPWKLRESERWDSWALAYLSERYKGTGSWGNVDIVWRDLQAFFREKKILVPRQVTYRLTAEFIPWRLATKELARVGPTPPDCALPISPSSWRKRSVTNSPSTTPAGM